MVAVVVVLFFFFIVLYNNGKSVCMLQRREKNVVPQFSFAEKQETRPTLKGSTHCIGFGWYLPIVEKRSDETSWLF